jgi:periplasmic protein TonB
VSDAISRLLAERERQDHGLNTTLLVSLTGHFGLAALAVVLPMLLPREPPLKLNESVFVVMPRGGGGTPQAPAPPAPEPVAKPKPEESAAPPPPPVVLKPPPKAEPRPNALPLPDAKTKRATPPPVRAVTKPMTSASSGSAGTTAATKSAASATPGLEFGPPGPGVPTGTETGGDWYLASVQQKIWMIWNQQIKTGYTQSVGITFTIQPDGTVTDVRLTEPSGASLLDLAAQRAVLNAAPFGPLPREYGQKSFTIRALFKPTF